VPAFVITNMYLLSASGRFLLLNFASSAAHDLAKLEKTRTGSSITDVIRI